MGQNIDGTILKASCQTTMVEKQMVGNGEEMYGVVNTN